MSSRLKSSSINRTRNNTINESAYEELRDLDDDERRNNAVYRQLMIYHASLSEKLYSELCSLAFGEFNTDDGEISPVMWTRLYDIFVETEKLTRKLPVNSKQSTLSQKYASEAVQLASIMAIYTALPHEHLELRDSSLLAHLVVEDVEFRKIYALLLWSEKAISEQQYENGLNEKVKKLESFRTTRDASIMALKRSQPMRTVKDASINPDENGLEEDYNAEQNAMNIMLQLIRCGESAKAAEIALNFGMGPLSAEIMIHTIYRQPKEIPLKSDFLNRGAEKRSKRATYLNMMQKLIDNTKKNEDDPRLLILQACRGCLNPMLKISNTIVEKIWAYAKSAFLARMISEENAMKETDVSALFNVPLTVNSILSELITKYQNSDDVVMLLSSILTILDDDINGFFKFARQQIDGFTPNPSCDVNVLALDFFFHMICILNLSGYELNEDAQAVICAEFEDLRQRYGSKPHRRMAPFYSRFLSNENKTTELLKTMKLVESEDERELFAQSLIECDLNYSLFACSLIDIIRDGDNEDVIELNEQIDQWHWLLLGNEETSLAAIEEANRLIRKCLLSSNFDDTTVRSIIRKTFNYDVPSKLENLLSSDKTILSLDGENGEESRKCIIDGVPNNLDHAMHEFTAYCTFIDVFNFMVTISLKLGVAFEYEPIREEELAEIGGMKHKEENDLEASLKVRARTEKTIRDEAMKKRDTVAKTNKEIVLQYIQHAMPLFKHLLGNIGWNGEYLTLDDNDNMKRKREELIDIRNQFVPKFLLLFSQALSKLDKEDMFYEYLVSFDVDGIDLGIQRDVKRYLSCELLG